MLHQREKGQILLVVILVIIIASTIGLSLASRSITNLRTSTEEAESQKALAAAEAGIEKAIQGNIPIGADISFEGSHFLADVDDVKDDSFLLNGGSLIPKNEGTDVWFVEHDNDGNPDYSEIVSPNFFSLYWGTSEEECPAAIQVIAFSRISSTDIKTYRYAYDNCRDRENNFDEAESGKLPLLNIDFSNKTSDNSDLSKLIKDSRNKIVFIRVIPLYKDTVIGVSTCNPGDNQCRPLPTQGYMVTSTGTSGEAKRKLTYFKGYPQTYLPYVSYGLFVAK